MTWDAAGTWPNHLVHRGFDDWRLLTIDTALADGERQTPSVTEDLISSPEHSMDGSRD